MNWLSAAAERLESETGGPVPPTRIRPIEEIAHRGYHRSVQGIGHPPQFLGDLLFAFVRNRYLDDENERIQAVARVQLLQQPVVDCYRHNCTSLYERSEMVSLCKLRIEVQRKSRVAAARIALTASNLLRSRL